MHSSPSSATNLQSLMAHQQLYPLEVNPSTGEPFLRLPSPLNNIIITPPRLEDAPSIVAILNDPRVYKTLQGPPFPYLHEHATEWLADIKRDSDAILRELEEALKRDPEAPLSFVRGSPVRTLREVREDGSDIFLGDLMVERTSYQGLVSVEEKERLSKENHAREVGDPDIVWRFGDYLAGSHHGRGVMSAAIGALMREWMIPRMGVRHVRVEAFQGNKGSIRVFEKNGFVLGETVPFDPPKITNCGEAQRGLHILWWHI